jgi:glycosyltransferase involved in cell wall biosynthesis
VLLRGLKELGWDILECDNETYSIKKYWHILKKHRLLRGRYDVAFIAYSGHVLVPLVNFLTRKKIVFNASNSLFDGVILNRQQQKRLSFLGIKLWIIDFVAFALSDIVLIETNAQVEFIARTFFVKRKKLMRVWVGVDETDFFPDKTVVKNNVFTVLFRGAFLPFVGVEHIIEAARILAKEEVKFLVIGNGLLEKSIKEKLKAYSLSNVELITEFLPIDELRKRMLSCHIAIGQISSHELVSRTVTNKTFEYLALGLPFITADSLSTRELLTDGKHCLFAKGGDVGDLVQKILYLKDNSSVREELSLNGRALFDHDLTSKGIADGLSERMKKLV